MIIASVSKKTRPHIILWQIVSLVLLLTGPAPASRLHPDLVEKRAKEAEKHIDQPAEHYREIYLYLIQPGRGSTDRFLKRFSAALEEAQMPRERAAIRYLIAETHYWGVLKKIRQTRNIGLAERAPEEVIPAFLEAFEEVRNLSGEEDHLRADIIRRLRRLAGSNVFGASLSDELKRRMVREFITPLEGQEDGPASWSLESRGKIYRNLGIQHRLDPGLPDTVPQKQADVLYAMRRALAAGRFKEGVPFARRMEKLWRERENPPWRTLYEIFQIYEGAGSPRALPLLKDIAKNRPALYLEVYELSRTLEPDIVPEERLNYIWTFLRHARKAAEGNEQDKVEDGNEKEEQYLEKFPSRLSRSYLKAVQFLIFQENYEGALEIAREFLLAETGAEDAETLNLWYCKAICYEALGKKQQAIAAYERCLSESGSAATPRLKEMSQQALSRMGVGSDQHQSETKGTGHE